MNSLLLDTLPDRLHALLCVSSPPLVCVLGLGTVGLSLAVQIAQLTRSGSQAAWRVIALEDPSQQARMAGVNQGQLPVSERYSERLRADLDTAVLRRQNLLATSDPMVLRQAAVIVLDLTTLQRRLPTVLEQIAHRMNPHSLLILVGAQESGISVHTILLQLQETLQKTPELAWLNLQAQQWLFSANTPWAKEQAQAFLSQIHPDGIEMQLMPTLEDVASLSQTFSDS